jgi:hypothetical protein
MGSSELNGSIPAIISKIKIPKVHQSTEKPCPLLSKTSGAKYSAVPQKLKV